MTGSLEPGQAGRHHPAADRPPQHLPDQRPDRRGGLGHGHVERRLGLRRRQASDARRRPRGERASRPATWRRRPSTASRPPPGSPPAPHRGVSGERDDEGPLGSAHVVRRRLSLHAGVHRTAPPRHRGVHLGAGDRSSGVALRAIAPYGAVLGITALGQMLVIMTGGIDLSVPGTMSLAAVIMVGVGDGSNEQIVDRHRHRARRRRGRRTGQRHPDRRAQAEPAHRHPGGGSDRGRRGQSLRDARSRSRARCRPGCPTGRRPASSVSAPSSGSVSALTLVLHRRPSLHGGRSPVPGGGRQPGGLPRRRCPGER